VCWRLILKLKKNGGITMSKFSRQHYIEIADLIVKLGRNSGNISLPELTKNFKELFKRDNNKFSEAKFEKYIESKLEKISKF
jgi:hypothetical protein